MRLFCFFSLVFLSLSIQGQQSYYCIYLKDKASVTFNPEDYFHSKALIRRKKMNISRLDSTDFPVQENYVRMISSHCDSIYGTSRWLNAVFVRANSAQADVIQQFTCVRSIEKYEASDMLTTQINLDEGIDLNLIKDQTQHLQGDVFEKNNMRGKGLRIAVFDAGFPKVDVHPAFAHLIREKRIVKTFDFVRNKVNVFKHSLHGTSVLSCIAGIFYGVKLGLATEAEFLLAITEYGRREPFSEEVNWLKAAEWADQNGVDIINSSLGYTTERYFAFNMDGKTSLVSQAARMAVRKGILVVNSAGNEGSDRNWRIIGTPADVDSVLSIGGINPYNNYRISFSSIGPTANKILKPNVCAFGQVIAANKKSYEETFGTSFAAPLVAGFAACAWQTDTNLTNMNLFKKIESSGTLYPYFDYAHGYGVPQASRFFLTDSTSLIKPTFFVFEEKNRIRVEVLDDFIDTVGFENINEAVLKSLYNYLYFHIEDANGVLKKYSLLEVYTKKALEIPRYEIEKGEILRIFYKDYLFEKKYE